MSEEAKGGGRLLLGLVVAIVVIWGGFKMFGGGPQLEGPLKIGAVLPLTGNGAAYGTPIQKAANLAVEEINAAGGIDGNPIELIWEDGKCEGEPSTTAAQKLVNIDKVSFIVGGACSSEALAMANITSPAKVLLISPSATSPDLTTEGGDYFFRLSPSDALAGSIAADYAYNELGAKKVAIIHENTDYAQGLANVFSEGFTAHGGEVAVTESFNTTDVDFRTALLKVKEAEVDVLYLAPQTPAPGTQLARQASQLGLNVPLLTGEVMIGRDVISENATALEGMIGFEAHFDSDGQGGEFLAKYEESAGEEAPFPSFLANMYTSIYMIKEAVEAHGLDTEEIRSWLLDLEGYEHAAGKISFDENGDRASDYAVLQAKAGKADLLAVVSPGGGDDHDDDDNEDEHDDDDGHDDDDDQNNDE